MSVSADSDHETPSPLLTQRVREWLEQFRGLFSVSRSRAAVARQAHNLRVDGSIPSSATHSSPPVVIQSWTASAVLFCLDIGSAILCVKTIGLMPGVLGYRDFS